MEKFYVSILLRTIGAEILIGQMKQERVRMALGDGSESGGVEVPVEQWKMVWGGGLCLVQGRTQMWASNGMSQRETKRLRFLYSE